MKKYSDKTILIGIKNKKNSILEYLYKDYFPQILRIIVKCGGNEQDAKDLFQEALIIIFNRLMNNNLTIRYSFHNYFIVLCKFIWFRQKKLKNYLIDLHEFDEFSTSGKLYTDNVEDVGTDAIYEEYLANQYEKIYQRHYKKLSGNCKKILKLFFRKNPFKEIAKKMAYKNEDYARRKKYLCMQQLIEMIATDIEYIELQKKKKE